ncbi:NAD-aldehyde dehydrogenase [Mycena rebaudengoi]|nr:NAD-aldehyde dehydrogenase [Mycena rebaudengoi]
MATLEYTPIEEIDKIHGELRAGFNSGKTKSVAYRKYQLLQLAYLVRDNEERFVEALRLDLGRPVFETQFLEIGASISELLEAHKNVDEWAKPEKAPFSLNFTFMRPVTYKEPKGVVLIISPFNYPLWLCMSPLAGAIAAGNTVVYKPSESNPATASLLAELFPKYIDPSLLRVVNGAIPETTKVFFYTGSGRVGRIVATAAAKHLTPVSLEVFPGLHRPCLGSAVGRKRILWGKFTNGGQTCVAPDYILVPRAFQDKFVDALKVAYANFYPETTAAVPTPPQWLTKMINEPAFKRVTSLLQNSKGTIVCGGQVDEATKFIAPTIVKDVQADDSLMSEEIFGPVLPSAIAYVNAHDHPLALYVFSQDASYKKKVFESTQSGSAVANETIIIGGVSGLPFGGIGPSGRYLESHFISPPMPTALHSMDFKPSPTLRASIDSPGWIDKAPVLPLPAVHTAKNLQAMQSQLAPKLPARPAGPPGAAASNP